MHNWSVNEWSTPLLVGEGTREQTSGRNASQMRQAEARDLRSFLVEPVEEISLDRGREEGDSWDDAEDFMLQQTKPMPMVSDPLVGQRLRPYRLGRYQSRGVTVALSRSVSGSLRLRPATAKKSARRVSGTLRPRVTEQLAPAAQKIVPVEPSSRRQRDIYVWLVLMILFLLVVLGGIGLDSLIASHRW